MAYLKPQSPIKYKEDHIYPLTTIDQIIMDDGQRLSGVGVYLEKPDENEETTVKGVNADTLGGIAASDYVLKTDTIENATNADTLGGKAPIYYIQPRNLFDNSDFTNPVNQRGQTSYTGTAYTIDRWVAYSPTGTVATTVGSNGIIVNPGNDGIATYTQRFPADSLPDGDYTFAWMDGSGVVHIDNNPINISGEMKYVGVGLNSETVMVWAALYEGEYTADTLPPYVPKGYAAELAECQRYYIKIADTYGRPIGFGMTYGTTNGRILIPTPVTMRDIPSIIATPSKLRLTINEKQYVVSTIGERCLWGNGVVATFHASDAPSNYPCVLFMAESEIFALSADL